MSKQNPNRKAFIKLEVVVEFQPNSFEDELERERFMAHLIPEVVSYINHKAGSTILGAQYKNAEITNINCKNWKS